MSDAVDAVLRHAHSPTLPALPRCRPGDGSGRRAQVARPHRKRLYSGSPITTISTTPPEATPIAKQQQSFTRINDSIRVPQVRLIGADGEQVGVIDTAQAMQMAEQVDLDLVEVAPEARPPVCRIMDYGKYRYDKEKKAKEARKKQHNVQMKTVRIKMYISEHDLQYRLGHIREFIGHGYRVKVSMRFLGRMMAYRDRGREVMEDVARKMEDVAAVDQLPQMEGREMSMILHPI